MQASSPLEARELLHQKQITLANHEQMIKERRVAAGTAPTPSPAQPLPRQVAPAQAAPVT